MDGEGDTDGGRSRRELLANIGLAATSGGLTLSGLEGALRAGIVPYDRGRSSETIYCTSPEKLHQFHPTYGWTLVPNAEYIRHWQRPDAEDSWLLFRTNDEGFRDTYDSGEDTVLVLGDSFTEGAGVSQGGQYAHLLDRWAPNTAFRAYAAGGYGTDQELLVYRDVGDRYDHDVVVLQYYFGNDVRNNAGKGWPPGPRRPRFELQGDELVQVHEPVDEVPEGAAGFRDYGAVGTVHSTLRDASYAYDWLYKRGRGALVAAGVVETSPTSGFDVPTGETLDRQLRLTRALLEAVGSRAANNGADLLVTAVPARGDVDPERPEHYPVSQGRPFYQAQREMLQAVAETTANVGLLDLTPVMRREHQQGNQVYDGATGHFNLYGYRVMARRIYERLVAAGHLTRREDVDFQRDYTEPVRTCP